MAISIETSMYSNPATWNLDHHSSPLSSDLGGLSDATSAQYLLSASDMGSNNLFPYFNDSSDFSQSSSSSPASTCQKSRAIESRLGTATKATKMRKPATALGHRASAATDLSAPSVPSEKKRNKLGYHRTSVACGHCRRRKIRCISNPGEKRCSNCIRLKKECKFFPVDQQSQTSLNRKELKAQSTVRRISEEISLPSSISDQISNVSLPLSYSSHFNMPSIQSLGPPQIKRLPAVSFSPGINKGIRSVGKFTGHNNGPDINNWMASDSLSIPEPTQETSRYWIANSQSDSITSSYSPFGSCLESPSPSSWSPGRIDSGLRGDLPWPARTIPSLNSLQDLNSPAQYAQYSSAPPTSLNYHMAKQQAPQSLDLYQTSIPTSTHQITTGEQADDRPRQLKMGNFSLHVPLSSWEQSFSYQKHSSPGSEQYSSWDENHGDVIPLHAETIHDSLSYSDGLSGRDIYFPLNQGR